MAATRSGAGGTAGRGVIVTVRAALVAITHLAGQQARSHRDLARSAGGEPQRRRSALGRPGSPRSSSVVPSAAALRMTLTGSVPARVSFIVLGSLAKRGTPGMAIGTTVGVGETVATGVAVVVGIGVGVGAGPAGEKRSALGKYPPATRSRSSWPGVASRPPRYSSAV